MNDFNKKAPPALTPMTESEIIAGWSKEGIVVSVICAAFNQENFIDDAICGFLAQKTNFPFEVIIRDDASSDKTPSIIRDYAEKYPKIIKPIFESVNRFPVVKPGSVMRRLAKGQYFSYCEGDDYWVDPLKLQKQVDFLEMNPEVSLLETGSVAVENGVVIEWPKMGGTRTIMHPSKIKVPDQYSSYIYFGDTYMKSIMAMHGKQAMLDDVTAVWRKHDGGVFGGMQNDAKKSELSFQGAASLFWTSVAQYEGSAKKDSINTLYHSVNYLLKAHPGISYIIKLKLALKIIAGEPVGRVVAQIKKILKR